MSAVAIYNAFTFVLGKKRKIASIISKLGKSHETISGAPPISGIIEFCSTDNS
jgi:hypothetical protein